MAQEKSFDSRHRSGLVAILALSAVLLLPASGIAELIHLHNGDVLQGAVIGASEGSITLKTTYGNLVISKTDIKQIDYQGAEPASEKPLEKGVLVRMVYQVNEGSWEFPRWTNAVSRSFLSL